MGAPSELLKNRKRAKKARMLLAISASILVTFVVISYLGVTVAHYLANSTTVAFSNRSLGNANLMKIGFRVATPIDNSDLSTYHLTSDSDNDTSEDGYIYWSDITVGASTMKFIVEHDGYASGNAVQPITSSEFAAGDDLTLYSRPSENHSNFARVLDGADPASKQDYVSFDLLFQVGFLREDQTVVGVSGNPIYFDNDTTFAGTNNVTSALRLGFVSDLTSDIIDPSATEAGSIDVGGPMDLDGDGYFDYTTEPTLLQNGTTDDNMYEIAYGAFADELTDANWGEPATADIPPASDTQIFYDGAVKEGVCPLIDYTPAVAAYEPLSNYQIDTGSPIATTNSNGIAEVKIMIWLEGWDHDCTNQLISSTFGAQLKFVSNSADSE